MSAKNRGLGKGFDSLIPKKLVEAEFDPTAKSKDEGAYVNEVQIDLIDPNPNQPRVHFAPDSLESLAASIKRYGIVQPLVVRPVAGRYQLIAGERRLRAAKLANQKTVPAVIRSENEQRQMEVALVENLQRDDLNAVETATAYQKLIDEFNETPKSIGAAVGKVEFTVRNTIRLLNLPIEAKRAIAAGKISEGHARQILAIKDPAKQQQLLKLIIDRGWTVRQAEHFVLEAKRGKTASEPTKRSSAVTNDTTKNLSKKLKTDVMLEPRSKGGRLVIRYKDDKDLERITKYFA